MQWKYKPYAYLFPDAWKMSDNPVYTDKAHARIDHSIAQKWLVAESNAMLIFPLEIQLYKPRDIKLLVLWKDWTFFIACLTGLRHTAASIIFTKLFSMRQNSLGKDVWSRLEMSCPNVI